MRVWCIEMLPGALKLGAHLILSHLLIWNFSNLPIEEHEVAWHSLLPYEATGVTFK